MLKSYRIRLYPNKSQEQLLWKHVNCCRFVYNLMLEKQIDAYKNGDKHISHYSMNKLLTPLRKDPKYLWLQDVSITSLQRSCGDLESTFKKFFSKRCGFPKFKSKRKSKDSFPVCCRESWFDKFGFFHTIKVGKIKYKTDQEIPLGTKNKFINMRVYCVLGKWFVTFSLLCEKQAQTLNDFSLGIDLGVKELAVVAYDARKKIVFHNINKSKKVRLLNKRIRMLQRSISRKYEANKHSGKRVKTKNIEKLERTLHVLRTKLSNIRNNYIHQCTSTLVKLFPKRIVMESLNVKGMLKNRHLAKAISEQCFGEFIRQIQYKCEWNGIGFVQVDRFFPSSKTCHNCGCVKHTLKLSDRTFVCEECGYTEDRDFNAALNLMSYKD